MVDLADFRAKQILQVPNLQTSHGGIFATPNTRVRPHLVEGAGAEGVEREPRADVTLNDHLNRYADIYRGYSTFVKVDPEDRPHDAQGELPDRAAAVHAGPRRLRQGRQRRLRVHQLLQRGDGDRWHPAGQAADGSRRVPARLRLSAHHQLEEGRAGRRGRQVHRASTASASSRSKPRSPKGCCTSRPSRAARTASTSRRRATTSPWPASSIRTSTVYGIDKIKQAIAAKNFEGKDRYGIPILKFDAVVAGKVELGAGPLHTQYDDKGNAYTSLYLESAVAKWTLGEPYHPADKAFKLVDKVSIHYNIGHLATAQGDTMDPQGKYLIAMNKWSIDRHTNVGPLHPQNFQLIDISGPKMELLADMPIGFGEPHYAQLVKADTIKAHDVYEPGTSPMHR